MLRKIEIVASLIVIVGSFISCITAYKNGDKQLALAWGSSCLWAFSSLGNNLNSAHKK